MENKTYTKIAKLVDDSQDILIIQADNPDGDSLGTALALEYILSAMTKNPILYSGVDMPSYLRYMKGWDRVVNELPPKFDLVIFVDVSTLTLLEKLTSLNLIPRLRNKPTIVFDHHEIVENKIDFADITLNDSTKASTGELIYSVMLANKWPQPTEALEFILYSILSDTQGLSNRLASSSTFRIVADIIDKGVDRAALEEKRREYSKMNESIFRYKARLINRVVFTENNKIAYVSVSQDEINEYSPSYNPAPLIQTDILNVEDVMVAIVFKIYDGGKITGAIRTTQTAPIANKLADLFGGGGHSFASGFKIDNTNDPNKVIRNCLKEASSLLLSLKS